MTQGTCLAVSSMAGDAAGHVAAAALSVQLESQHLDIFLARLRIQASLTRLPAHPDSAPDPAAGHPDWSSINEQASGRRGDLLNGCLEMERCLNVRSRGKVSSRGGVFRLQTHNCQKTRSD